MSQEPVASASSPSVAPEEAVHLLDLAGRTVQIREPDRSSWERSPGDVLRVVVAALVTLLAFVVFDFASNTVVGFEEDVREAVASVPTIVLVAVYSVVVILAGVIPTVVLVWLLVRHNWRLLGLYLVTTLAATTVFLLLQDFIRKRVPALPDPPDDLPGWLADLSWSPDRIAVIAAALVVSGPWMSRRWRRVAWFLLLTVIPLVMLVGLQVPSGLLLALAGGWLVGSLTVLAFGSPQRNPGGAEVVQALDDSGIHLAELHRAGVDARGSTPYFGTDVSGQGLFIKVLGFDERNADLMFRVYRWFRLRNIGDERPFSSLRRTVEHEALVAVMAERAGVVTPQLVATVELADGSMALVYERVAGRSLDTVDPSEVTAEVLRGVWQQIALLRSHRIAHRDLRRANVFLGDDGQPMLIDFGFGEVSATRLLLDQDVAQFVVSSAVDVGAERAVTDAVAVIGPEAVAAAAPRMQPLALAGATQSALKKQKDLLGVVQEQVLAQTELEEIELAPLERIKPKTVLMAALLFGAVWFIIPQLAELPRIMEQIRDADWIWVVPALVFSMLTYVGAAMALASSVQVRLPLWKTTLVTLGGSFVNRISPAKIGGIALNLRFLQKQGVEVAVATASVGLYQGVGMLVHLSLLLIFGIWAGRSVSISELLPSGTVIFVVAAVVLSLIGLVILVPKLRRGFQTWVAPQLSKVGANLKDLVRRPVRLLVMVSGSALLTLSYIAALWASIQAFGGGVSVAGIAVVFLAGASIASAAPTPGGIGAVEAALVAGLTALGLASAIAVPAVFLYRLATFWVPVVPGWLGFSLLQRRGDI